MGADLQRFLIGCAAGWRVKRYEQAQTDHVLAALRGSEARDR